MFEVEDFCTCIPVDLLKISNTKIFHRGPGDQPRTVIGPNGRSVEGVVRERLKDNFAVYKFLSLPDVLKRDGLYKLNVFSFDVGVSIYYTGSSVLHTECNRTDVKSDYVVL